jgi:uncharacterized protein GlcG (DUF336 family)
MLMAPHAGRIRLSLGVGLLFLLLTGGVLLGRAGQAAHAQSASPVSLTERAITQEAAEAVIRGAVARAHELGLAQVFVVVDGNGLMKAMVRMDTARVSSISLAHDKAYTAAVRRQSTEEYGNGFAGNPVGLASAALQPHMYLGAGGLPIIVDGQVIGAIGASGGTGAQDVEAATAGLDAIR